MDITQIKHILLELFSEQKILTQDSRFILGKNYSALRLTTSFTHLFKTLAQVSSDLCFYLKSSDNLCESLAIDSILKIKKNSESDLINETINSHPHLTWYGARSFSEGRTWSDFGECLFFIPRIEYKNSKTSYIQFNFSNDILKPENIDHFKEYLIKCFELLITLTPLTTPNVLSKTLSPSQNDWVKLVNLAKEEFKKSELKKVVLSRREEIKFSDNLDAYAIASELHKLNFENSYFTYFKYSNNSTFLSLTPEVLFKTDKSELVIDAIAGTIKRDLKDGLNDQSLAQNLLNDPKELSEHRFVIRNIKEVLKSLNVSPILLFEERILKLKHVQHIHSKITAKASGLNIFELLKRLHPTAAIGGYPKNLAQNFIDTHEPTARGLYSAPIGYLSKEESLMLVGIRSCLIRENTLSLFGGCGVVEESIPLNEWLETEIKMSNFKNHLTYLGREQ